MSKDGGKLIKVKDAIHTNWFELQVTKRSSPEYAFLPKSHYDNIITLAREALDELKLLVPQSHWINQIGDLLHEVEWKSWVSDQTWIGPRIYYVMTPERGRDVITKDINRLANDIHRAGMDMIKARDEYCGCNIAALDLRSINTGVLKYCQGTLKLGSKRGWVHEPGDTIEHRPGAATNHANRIRFEPTGKGYNLDIEYIESGDSAWRARQAGVVSFIEEKGGQCDTWDVTSKCQIENASEEIILELALLISQLKDIDLMLEDCIPVAFEEIRKQANELKQIKPETDIWHAPWKVAGNIGPVFNCVGTRPESRDEERREERRQTSLQERLEYDIENIEGEINFAVEKSKKDSCTYKPYTRLGGASEINRSIRDDCQQIKNETSGTFDWCFKLADQKDKEIKEAAGELVKRCPPEGIILGLEAASYPSYLTVEITEIESMCILAENKDCLDIISQVRARSEAGVQVAKLPFPRMAEVSV